MAQISELIPILSEKTGQRRVPWQVSEAGAIFCRVGSNFLEIEDEADDFGVREGLSIKIRNKNGEVLDSKWFEIASKNGTIVREIFNAGKRQALNIDVAIDEVVRALNDF